MNDEGKSEEMQVMVDEAAFAAAIAEGGEAEAK